MSTKKGLQQRVGSQGLGSSWKGESWCLPSGQRLAEYMLQSGLLAPLLFGPTAKRRRKAEGQEAETSAARGVSVRGKVL